MHIIWGSAGEGCVTTSTWAGQAGVDTCRMLHDALGMLSSNEHKCVGMMEVLGHRLLLAGYDGGAETPAIARCMLCIGPCDEMRVA